MTTYIVQLVDSKSQLFITWGWVYIQTNTGDSKTGITAGSGGGIGQTTIEVNGTCTYYGCGKDTDGVRQYQPYTGTTMAAAPVVNQFWLVPVGTGETIWVCETCGANFETQAELAEHVASEHPAPPPEPEQFCCNLCGDCFSTPEELTQHLLTVHNEDLPPPTSKGYCFIVTYTNVSENVLWKYRQFRDKCLPNPVIRFYYWLSPYIVKTFTGHETIRKTLKKIFTRLAGY